MSTNIIALDERERLVSDHLWNMSILLSHAILSVCECTSHKASDLYSSVGKHGVDSQIQTKLHLNYARGLKTLTWSVCRATLRCLAEYFSQVSVLNIMFMCDAAAWGQTWGTIENYLAPQ